ncbi:MAG: outer membrane beta-barrel protein [Thermodesulfobacteriota bacterium]
MKTVTNTLVALVFLRFFTPPLGAQITGPGTENIKAGPVEIHPFVELTETYSDNIYKNYGGFKKESDFITTLSPGIRLILPVKTHSFQLDYRADVNWYAKNSETNYINQIGGGLIKLEFPGGLNFNFSDYFTHAVIPRKAKETPGISGAADEYRELPYNGNDFNAMAKYRFLDRWAIEGRYNNYNYGYTHDYDKGGNFNRNVLGGSLYYRLTPKIDALVDYNFSTVDYKTDTTYDNTNHSAYLGVAFDPTAKLNGYLKLGWYMKNYKQDLANRKNSFSTPSTLIDLNYNLSPYHIFTLKGSWVIAEDVDTNAPMTATDFSLGYRHILKWHEKLSLNANIGYGTEKFKAPTTDADGTLKTRDDKKWYGGAGIGYAPKTWVSFSLNYIYTNNDSNFINYHYNENKVYLKASIAF